MSAWRKNEVEVFTNSRNSKQSSGIDGYIGEPVAQRNGRCALAASNNLAKNPYEFATLVKTPCRPTVVRRSLSDAAGEIGFAASYWAAAGFDSGFANLEASIGALSWTLVTRIVAVVANSDRALAGYRVIRYGNFTPLPVSR